VEFVINHLPEGMKIKKKKKKKKKFNNELFKLLKIFKYLNSLYCK